MSPVSASADQSLEENVSIESLGSIFVDAAAYADPSSWHAKAARIRDEAPILRVDAEGFPPFWAISTHADVLEVERHPEVFTNHPIQVMTGLPSPADSEDPPVKTLIQMDAEEHRSHRAIVNDWFKPSGIKLWADRVDGLARASIERMAALGGHCDFMNDVAVHFPLQVIMSILGLPESDYPRMLALTQELFGAEDPDIARIGEDQGILQVIVDFLEYFTALTAARRTCPTEDLASVVANARIADQALSDMDTFGYYLIIVTAGHDTTSNVIGSTLLALLDQPEQLALLKARPELIPHAVHEFIRYAAPVKHFLRTCAQRFTIRDVTFEPGDLVLLSFASATRDEAVYENPQRLNIERPPESIHLGFGFGRHFCLGAHLARMEVGSFYREFISRVEHIELAGEPTWVRANFVQGPKCIPVTYSVR